MITFIKEFLTLGLLFFAGYVMLLIGGFVPVLNTVVSYQIIKKHKEYEQ